MSERPIIFSGPMVRAILAGTKTQTRRIVRWPMIGRSDGSKRRIFLPEDLPREIGAIERLSPIRPGARLWVRETWASPQTDIVAYRADGACGAWMGNGGGGRLWVAHGWIQGSASTDRRGRWFGLGHYSDRRDRDGNGTWRSPIFMPRRASRITLEVVAVRVERLWEITEADAMAEGVASIAPVDGLFSARLRFERGWDSISKRGPWSSNPWVWVVEFSRVEAA